LFIAMYEFCLPAVGPARGGRRGAWLLLLRRPSDGDAGNPNPNTGIEPTKTTKKH
jgi:hypothetical protein